MTGRWTVRRDTTLAGPQWVVVGPNGRDVCVAPTQARAIAEIARRSRASSYRRRPAQCVCDGCTGHDGACDRMGAFTGPLGKRCSRCLLAERTTPG